MVNLKKMDHVAIAVKDLEDSLTRWRDSLGMKPGPIEEIAERGVRLCKLTTADGPGIELVSPLGADSPVAKFLAEHGEGIHHFCFEVEDIEGILEELKGKGARLINTQPVRGAEGSRIAFIHPESFNGVLIEVKQLG